MSILSLLSMSLQCPILLPSILVLTLGAPISHAGALKATNNRGLQPALDHLVENLENPVPDLSSVTSTTSSARPQGGGDPMDEDDDLDAVRAVYGTGGSGSDPGQTGAEAKVR